MRVTNLGYHVVGSFFGMGSGVPAGYKILKDADGKIVKDSSGKIVLVRE